MRKSVEIEMPWPPRGLSPNARLDRFAKATLFKRTKMAAFIATARALDGHKPSVQSRSVVNVKMICTPPTNRRRDEDNLIANCKAIFDGIAQKLEHDDHNFHFLEQEWRPAVSPGKIVFRVDWEEEDV